MCERGRNAENCLFKMRGSIIGNGMLALLFMFGQGFASTVERPR